MERHLNKTYTLKLLSWLPIFIFIVCKTIFPSPVCRKLWKSMENKKQKSIWSMFWLQATYLRQWMPRGTRFYLQFYINILFCCKFINLLTVSILDVNWSGLKELDPGRMGSYPQEKRHSATVGNHGTLRVCVVSIIIFMTVFHWHWPWHFSCIELK